MEKRNGARTDDKTAKGTTAPAPKAPDALSASDNGGRRAEDARAAAAPSGAKRRRRASAGTGPMATASPAPPNSIRASERARTRSDAR